MKKQELRKQTIEKLKDISSTDKKQIEKQLHNRLFTSDLWKNSSIIATTISQGFEWDTRRIIKEGWKQGKVMVVPKCYPERKELVFYKLHHFEELETVYYNLLEPKPKEENKIDKKHIDLVIVPGVVFDIKGFRIGFGGGYYDRFLATYHGMTISLLSKIQLVGSIPAEDFDIAVQHLITEDGLIK